METKCGSNMAVGTGVHWVRSHTPPPFPHTKKFETQLSNKYNMPYLIMMHCKCDFVLLTRGQNQPDPTKMFQVFKKFLNHWEREAPYQTLTRIPLSRNLQTAQSKDKVKLHDPNIIYLCNQIPFPWFPPPF